MTTLNLLPQKECLNTPESPLAADLYSQAVKVGNTLYLSGLIGFTTERKFAGDSVEEQTEQIFKNLHAVLNHAGADTTNVVQVRIFLADMSDYAAVNNIYKRVFSSNPPARTCVAVSGLPFNAKVELEAIALAP